MEDAWEQLIDEISDARDRPGELTNVFFQRRGKGGSEVNDLLDRFSEESGFRAIGKGWMEIERTKAVSLAVRVLKTSLLQGDTVIKESEARTMVDSFFAFFEPEARCFSNGDYAKGSFVPLSQRTVDTGIVCLGKELLGMIWVAEND